MQAIRLYFDQILKLSDEEWEDFSACLEMEGVKKNHKWLNEGAQCLHLAFIESGMFRFYHLADGEEKITTFFFPGDFICNYRSFLTGQASHHIIEAMEDSVLYKIAKSDLLMLYQKHHRLERLGRLIAEHLYLGVAARLDSFHFQSAAERYEGLVKRNSKLLQAIPQYMLASYLGVKPETISRIRSKKF